MPGGIFIAFEGIDGAGKTTQVGRLAEFFAHFKLPFVRSKEPTGGFWGQKIRASAASERMSLDRELHAFVEDRKEHLREVIVPALQRGDTVILDRYFYSTIAYQGSRGGDVDTISKLMLEGALEPDAVMLLDVDPKIGLARIHERGDSPNAFEGIDNLVSVRAVFRKLAATHKNIVLIDGTPNEGSVHRAVIAALVNGALSKLHLSKHWGCEAPTECVARANQNCKWVQMLTYLKQMPA